MSTQPQPQFTQPLARGWHQPVRVLRLRPDGYQHPTSKYASVWWILGTEIHNQLSPASAEKCLAAVFEESTRWTSIRNAEEFLSRGRAFINDWKRQNTSEPEPWYSQICKYIREQLPASVQDECWRALLKASTKWLAATDAEIVQTAFEFVVNWKRAFELQKFSPEVRELIDVWHQEHGGLVNNAVRRTLGLYDHNGEVILWKAQIMSECINETWIKLAEMLRDGKYVDHGPAARNVFIQRVAKFTTMAYRKSTTQAWESRKEVQFPGNEKGEQLTDDAVSRWLWIQQSGDARAVTKRLQANVEEHGWDMLVEPALPRPTHPCRKGCGQQEIIRPKKITSATKRVVLSCGHGCRVKMVPNWAPLPKV